MDLEKKLGMQCAQLFKRVPIKSLNAIYSNIQGTATVALLGVGMDKTANTLAIVSATALVGASVLVLLGTSSIAINAAVGIAATTSTIAAMRGLHKAANIYKNLHGMTI